MNGDTITGPVEVGHIYRFGADGVKQLEVWVQLGHARYTFDNFDDALATIHTVFRRLGEERIKAEGVAS